MGRSGGGRQSMRIRFKLRSLMVLIAAVAIVLVTERVKRRSSYCLERAADCASNEAAMLRLAAQQEADAASFRRRSEEDKAEVEKQDLDDRRAWEQLVESSLATANYIDSSAKLIRRRAAYYAK